MEKKPRYFLVGGNGELTEETPSEKLPKLSDKEIDKLYSKLIKLDGKYKNFKGSKRDYCFTVSGLIFNFLKGNNLLGKEGGKLTDEQKAKKAAEAAEAKAKKAAEAAEAKAKKAAEAAEAAKEAAEAKAKKAADKEAADAEKKNKFLQIPKKEGDWTEEDIKQYFDKPTKTSNIKTGELTGKYLEQIVPGLGNVLGSTDLDNITYGKIKEHANKYKKVLELFCDGSGNQDIVSTKNFLILAPFDEIFLNTTKGNEQKQKFRNILITYKRNVGYESKSEWNQADTATIITETDYYKNYLSKVGFKLKDKNGNDLDDDMANVLMNAKIYSKFRSSGNIDFNTRDKIVELKGNIKNIRHQDPDPRCQVDLSKLLGSIFNLFYNSKGDIRIKPKQGSIDFYNYTEDVDIIKSKQSHLCTISLDILKLYNNLSALTKKRIKTILDKKIKNLDLTNDVDTLKYTQLLKIKPDTSDDIKEVINSLYDDTVKYFRGTGEGKKLPLSHIIVAKKNDSMLSLDMSKEIIRKKLYFTQINRGLELKGKTHSELLEDYCKFLSEEGPASRRMKQLYIIERPTPKNIIPVYKDMTNVEFEPEEPEIFDPKEYFYKIAKELLQNFVDKKNYTEAEIEDIIEDYWNDLDPKPVSKEKCDDLADDLYHNIEVDLEEPDVLDPDDEVKLEKREKREELKTTIRDKRKILKQKYDIITDTDWNTFTEEEKKEIENMVEFHNSITGLKTKTDSELDKIEVELDKNIERIKNITNPPKPDQPVVAAGRRFYFKRF